MKKNKQIKVFLSALLAGTLLCTTATTTLAYDINITNTPDTTSMSISEKTYNAYQVLSATIAGDAVTYAVTTEFEDFFEDVLNSTTTTPGFLDDVLAYVNDFEDDVNKDLQDLVSLLRDYVTDSLTAVNPTANQTVATGAETVTITGLDSGYYLVLDAAGDGEFSTTGMLYNVNDADLNISVKGSLPTINKEVWHNDITNQSPDWAPEGLTNGSWDTVADYQIGDVVEYRITATTPVDLTGYDSSTYKYTITDTLTDGLEFDTSSISIHTAEDFNKNSDTKVPDTYYTATTTGFSDDTIFEIEFDVFKFDEDYSVNAIYVYYTATVLDTVNTFTETSKLNECNVVRLSYSNNPYDDTSFGEDSAEVYSYTFVLDVLKTKGDEVTPLDGATFGLFKGSNQLYLNNGGSGTVYYVDNSQVASNTAGVIVTDTNGEFSIKGLDDAVEYTLKEIEAPTGYNPADDIDFTIDQISYVDVSGVPTPDAAPSMTVGGTPVTDLSMTVVNTSSSLLPSTGGVGTTVFTVIGAVFMIAAVVLLVYKKVKEKSYY